MLKGRVKFWALVVSGAFHILLLGAFALVQFRPAKNLNQEIAAPTGRIISAKLLPDTASKISKPKIKRIRATGFSQSTALLPSPEQVFRDGISEAAKASLGQESAAPTALLWSSGSVLPGRMEFFGSSTGARRICFLVDCSGSMKGLFQRVKAELVAAIDDLQQDQYFGIIFFGDQRLYEFSEGKLVRASSRAKDQAHAFINSIRAAGYTNALGAFERASRMHDSQGQGCEVIFFLTDGFELTSQQAEQFRNDLSSLLVTALPSVTINTIGFWADQHDSRMLEEIAHSNGGEFVYIGSENQL